MKDMEYVDLQINNNDVCVRSCSMLEQIQIPTRTGIHTNTNTQTLFTKREMRRHTLGVKTMSREFSHKTKRKISCAFIWSRAREENKLRMVSCRIIKHDLVISRNGITRHLGQWFVNNLTFRIRAAAAAAEKQNNVIRLHSVKLCLNGRTTVNTTEWQVEVFQAGKHTGCVEADREWWIDGNYCTELNQKSHMCANQMIAQLFYAHSLLWNKS